VSEPEAERLYQRHFTAGEANAMLPTLEPLLERLRAAKSELTDEELHDALGEAAPANGGGDPGRKVGVAFLEVRRLLLALADAGVVVKDIDRGLVDFPALRDGREVFLCWQLGEDEVAHWHELETGYGGRRPLD
jgi:hypothetical protein